MNVAEFREPVPDAIAAALAILCAHYSRELDQDVARSYARKLQQRGAVSAQLLEPTVDRVLERRTFFPALSEFLEDLETVRKELLAQSPYTPCAACESTPGWIEKQAPGELSVRWLGNPIRGRNVEQELKAKPEFVKLLADSFAFCEDVIAALTDQNASELIKQGQGEVARAAAIAGLIAHNSEMYGISTVYLRAKNIVPPSTEQQIKRQRQQ